VNRNDHFKKRKKKKELMCVFLPKKNPSLKKNDEINNENTRAIP